MANRLFCTFRNSNSLLLSNLVKANNYIAATTAEQKIRHLYSKSTLGIDGFITQRERTQRQMENISGKFKEKMTEYSQENSKNMIFTEDLKNMIHISNTDEDVDLVVKMIKRFNQQNKQLRFGNYIFGPVVMRLFHLFNKADLALECFKSTETEGFFDHLMTYQLLLDLLYENQKYQEMLEVVDIIKDKQIEGTKYPRNIVVLALAACYKLNSKESLDYALKLWGELKDTGHFPMRRATTFCAGLALNQGKPGVAMEILTAARNQNYTTVRNLKVAALAEIGRVEDAIPILKSILTEDNPDNSMVHTFNQDVMERVKNAVAKLDNPDLALEFNRIEQLFQKQGHISNMSLSEQLCQEIQKPPTLNNRQDRQQVRYTRPQFEGRPNKYVTYRQRPGLEELV